MSAVSVLCSLHGTACHKHGDNRYYVFINAATRNVWCIPETAMEEHGYVSIPTNKVPKHSLTLHRAAR